MPKGYWIAHITITDNDAYQLYRNVVPAILAAHKARFIIRAGAQTVTEGAARPRTVVIEFPSYRPRSIATIPRNTRPRASCA